MFDLDTAKGRLGIALADTSKDTVIASAMKATIAIAENYCKRKFERKLEVEMFPHFRGTAVSLQRYPILHVDAVRDNEHKSRVMKYQIDSAAGLIEFHGQTEAEYLVVEYDAGYDPLPDDLEIAFWAIFDEVYTATSTSGGAGGGGAIEKASLVGVGSVTFAKSGAAAAGVSPDSGLPYGLGGVYLNLLNNYKRELA